MKRRQKTEESVGAKLKINDYFKPDEARAASKSPTWQKITAENLDCDVIVLFSKSEANSLYTEIEKNVQYNTGKLAKVKMYGKWMDIPRKQTAFGDHGLTYTFSGNTIPAKRWPPFLLRAKEKVEAALSHNWKFNFVLVNRYKDGDDHIGEHRDGEKDLDRSAPIASVSLGQERDFVFRHKDARGKYKSRGDLQPVSVNLKNGSLFVMNPPTNEFWYHSLPVRKRAAFPRVNLTFRVMTTNKGKSA